MVISGFLSVLGTVLTWVLGLLPHFGVPSWFSGLGSAVATVSGALSGTSSWVPWTAVMVGLGVIFAAVGVSVAIRGFRIVASFLTAGGGS